jgi:hypothetical protein
MIKSSEYIECRNSGPHEEIHRILSSCLFCHPPEKTIAQQQAEARAGTREEDYTMSGGLGERSVEIGSHLEASGKYGDNDTRGIWYNVGVGSTLL